MAHPRRHLGGNAARRLASLLILAAALVLPLATGGLLQPAPPLAIARAESDPGYAQSARTVQVVNRANFADDDDDNDNSNNKDKKDKPKDKDEDDDDSGDNSSVPATNHVAERPNLVAEEIYVKDGEPLVAGRRAEFCVVWSVLGTNTDQRFDVELWVDKELKGQKEHRVRREENERDCFDVVAPAGVREVAAFVDPPNDVSESDENDNVVRQAFEWAAAPMPNLVPAWADFQDDVYCGEVRFRLFVLNMGTDRARESQAQLLVNGQQPDGGKRRVGRLDPDEGEVVVFGEIYLQPGAIYDFIALVDVDEEVDEELEIDNDRPINYTVDPTCVPNDTQDDDDDD